MSNGVEVDIIRRVFVEAGQGACIEVGPWADDPGCVEIRLPDKPSEEWFGAGVRFSMSRAFAAALGRALIDAAAESK